MFAQQQENTGRRIQHLARLVEQDIASRGLKPGDRYLTTMEVAGLLGVSTRFANDAMRYLAARQVLTRKPKAGTLVGPGLLTAAGFEPPTPLDVVHLLIRQDYYFSERRRMEALVTGITGSLPGCSIQLNFVPAFNEVPYVERLMDGAAASRNGYLVAVKSPQLQRFFARHRSPSVLLGTPFEGIKNLAWIDKDQREIGRLLARRLIETGHRRIGVILRDRRGYGDDLMMDAITQEVLDGGLGSAGLIVRSVPADPPLIALAVGAMLSSDTRPSALICRNRGIVTAAIQTCAALDLTVEKDLVLALADPPADPRDTIAVPCLRPTTATGACGEGERLAAMLIALARGEDAAKLSHVIPVSL
jgi:hypothetical protein